MGDDEIDAERRSAATEVATEWFGALFSGDAETTVKLSAVPFAWDRKEIVASAEQLEELIGQVVKRKGARALPPTTTSVKSDERRIDDMCFPVDRVIVRLAIGDEFTDICVRPGKEYRVVGFSD